MKPAIAYGITGSAFGLDWQIFTVTSEKSGPRGVVYGRDQHGCATRHKPGDVHGRFPTIEQANAAQQALRQIHRDHAPGIETAERHLRKLADARRGTITQALENIRVTPLPVEPAA